MKNKNLLRSVSAFAVMACIMTAALVVNQAYASTSEVAGGDEISVNDPGDTHFMKDVEKTVEDVENGIIVTMTSDDATIVEKLQGMQDFRHVMHGIDEESVTKTVELLDNGVRVTITSDDATVVEKLQNCDEKPADIDISRTVENIDNGVVITLTSDDADVVQMLQENDGKLHGGFGHGHGHGGEDDEF